MKTRSKIAISALAGAATMSLAVMLFVVPHKASAGDGGPIAKPPQAGTPLAAVDTQVRLAVEKALRQRQTRAEPSVGAPAPTEAELQRQTNEGKAGAHAVFGGKELEKELAAVDQAVVVQRNSKGNFISFGGGIDNLVFHKIDIDPTLHHATVTCTYDAWASMTFRNPDGSWNPASPRNSLNATITLDNTTGPWLVTDDQWEFVPGKGV